MSNDRPIIPAPPCPEDHPILDAIFKAVYTNAWSVARESECIEFYDPEERQWFEIVVRRIDNDEQPDGTES